jgi:hypothetical protein
MVDIDVAKDANCVYSSVLCQLKDVPMDFTAQHLRLATLVYMIRNAEVVFVSITTHHSLFDRFYEIVIEIVTMQYLRTKYK